MPSFRGRFLTRLIAPPRMHLESLSITLATKQRPLRAVAAVMALGACLGNWVVMLPPSVFAEATVAGNLEPEMVVIQPGEFLMGDLSGVGNWGERPVRKVIITRAFAIGKYEVTVEEYNYFAKTTKRALAGGARTDRGKRPVISVSWEDARSYAEWLSKRGGKAYRLPTEAEWEYAARAGMQTLYWWGNKIGRKRANCDECGSEWDLKQSAPVGSFAANPFGLHDTVGNVWEWTQDCWHANYRGAPADGSPWLGADGGDCNRRVVRGGSWSNDQWLVRSSSRAWFRTDFRGVNLGFRVAHDLE